MNGKPEPVKPINRAPVAARTYAPSQPSESLNGHLAHSHLEHMLLDQLPYACLIGCRQ